MDYDKGLYEKMEAEEDKMKHKLSSDERERAQFFWWAVLSKKCSLYQGNKKRRVLEILLPQCTCMWLEGVSTGCIVHLCLIRSESDLTKRKPLQQCGLITKDKQQVLEFYSKTKDSKIREWRKWLRELYAKVNKEAN